MEAKYIFIVLLIPFSLQNVIKNVTYDDQPFRIYLGEEAKPSSAPYFVFLYTYQSSVPGEAIRHQCGGSLITANCVLTAAHCLKDTYKTTVKFGAKTIKDDGPHVKEMTSTRYKIHDGYTDDDVIHDIGVIELPHEIEISERISLVTLPKKSDADITYLGVQARLIGFGRESDSDNSSDRKLKQLKVTIVSATPTTIAGLGESGGSACMGDSGGPLVTKDSLGKPYQIGIVSYGNALGCEHGYVHVYTKVASYVDWIREYSIMSKP